MRRMTIAITALLMVLTACSSATESTTTISRGGSGFGSGKVGVGTSVHLVKGALTSFQACDDFLRHVKAEAIERVGPYGLDWFYGSPWAFNTRAVTLDEAFAAPEAAGEGDSNLASGYSQTNNQETGVDEPDVVKTDGKRIITLTNNTLFVVDVTDDGPQLAGSMALSPDHSVRDLFLNGDTVILMGSSWGLVTPLREGAVSPDVVGEADATEFGVVAPDQYFGGSPIVTLTEVDISDEPKIVRSLQLDGSYLNSRLIDGVARIVSTSGPTGFVWDYPEGSGLRAERDAIAANKKIIERSTIENWVPYFVLSDAGGNVISEGAAVPCNRAHYPEEFAGFNMLSVVTIDLDSGLDIIDSTGVLATGETVYSSTDSMYVATNGWFDSAVFDSNFLESDDVTDGLRTQIHQFDISGKFTDYVATGSVPGYLINQFAMSEHNGDLRVASTTSPNWWGQGRDRQESMVSVLRPDDGELELIGQVDGLGKDEQIYSVRFLGDVAYLVTFRQVDPLFTIDLSDPSEPVARGELKIPGYSAYLHPISDSLILGIGQDATNEGRVEGSQISLFDVSDLDNPKRLDQLTMASGSSSTAEYDHRAFMAWGSTVVLPLTEYNYRDGDSKFFTGAVAVDVGATSLTKIGRIAHPDASDWDYGWNSAIVRSLVIGDSLYTISNRGILESDLSTLRDLAWIDLTER
ncbi:MAG: hypothetical protein GY720_21605 [bacterium]|nr:hypothetical protein [bacterium]